VIGEWLRMPPTSCRPANPGEPRNVKLKFKQCTRDEAGLSLLDSYNSDSDRQLKQRELTNMISIDMLANTYVKFPARFERRRVTFAHAIVTIDNPTTAIP
jgi:hypothetical protein